MKLKPLTRRITAEYRNANRQHVAEGATWYPDAHAYAQELANTYGITVNQASGVISALSPICAWGDNKRRARQAIEDYRTHGIVTRGHTSENIANVNMILNGEDPDTVLRGLKTNAFYHAIRTAGISGDAVIDRHAWNMLLGTVGNNAPTAKQYRDAVQMFDRASKILGVPVHVVQAITWVAWRERNAWKTKTVK